MTSKTRLFLASATGSVVALAGMATLAAAAVTPTVTTTIQNSSNVTISTTTVGSLVHATVVVASSTASTSPTGTVDFSLYANQSCTGTPTVQTGVALVNGQASSSNTALASGGLSYKTFYSGQGDMYSAATSSCSAVAATAPTPTTPGTISGTVFNDLNKNRNQDSGELGLSGWKIMLYQKATTSTSWWRGDHKKSKKLITATTTTDSNGNYSFTNLQAGTYTVKIEDRKDFKEKSDDKNVRLSNANPSADVDFAVIEKKKENHERGRGADKEDDWHDNGKHNGEQNGWQRFVGTITNFNGWIKWKK